MKKTLLLFSSAIFGLGVATAQEVVQVTEGNLWMRTGGMMVQAMSANGRYLTGVNTNWEAFIYDTETQTLVCTSSEIGSVPDEQGATQFRAVTDDGVAYGYDGQGGITLDMEGNFKVFHPMTEDEEMPCTPEDVTPDGKICVGFTSPSWTEQEPCYWENGEYHKLYYPDTAETGFWINAGARAFAVSDDGSIILGQLNNRQHTYPMVYWRRQEDGSYKYVAAYEDHFEDAYDGKTLKQYYTTGKDIYFSPACLSPDGKTVLVYAQPVNLQEQKIYPLQMALYNIEDNTVTYPGYDKNNFLYSDSDGLFTFTGISVEGYIVGFIGSPFAGSSQPFIIKPGEYNNALSFQEAFPGQDLLDEYSDFQLGGAPYLAVGISNNANRIAGYCEIEVQEYDTYGYATFYIDTNFNPSDGVSAIRDNAAGMTEYYSIDGLKLDAPVKGLNIVRTPEGKTSKIFVNQ